MIQVRDARPGEHCELADLMWAVDDYDGIATRMWERCDDDRHRLCVAEIDGARAGFLDGTFDSDLFFVNGAEYPSPHAYLTWLYVFPRHRQQNVGRALVSHYAARALDAGCSAMGLVTDSTPDEGVRVKFFESLGFAVCGQRGRHMVASVDAVLAAR